MIFTNINRQWIFIHNTIKTCLKCTLVNTKQKRSIWDISNCFDVLPKCSASSRRIYFVWVKTSNQFKKQCSLYVSWNVVLSFPFDNKTRTTIVVSNGRYNFYQIPFIQYLLSNTIFQIPFFKYHLSNTIYQIPFIKYLLSNTINQIPFNKYLLSNIFYQIPFIKYHLSNTICSQKILF